AWTARSAAAAPASATWQIISPVAGLMAGKVLFELPSTNLPPMNSGWSFTCGAGTRPALGVVAVAMTSPRSGECVTQRPGLIASAYNQLMARVAGGPRSVHGPGGGRGAALGGGGGGRGAGGGPAPG